MDRSCHACVNLSRLRSGFLSRRRCGLAVGWVALHRQQAGTRETSLREIFKCAHLKFTVYGRKQASIHTHFRNAVMLVWGSLRLAPITHTSQEVNKTLVHTRKCRTLWGRAWASWYSLSPGKLKCVPGEDFYVLWCVICPLVRMQGCLAMNECCNVPLRVIWRKFDWVVLCVCVRVRLLYSAFLCRPIPSYRKSIHCYRCMAFDLYSWLCPALTLCQKYWLPENQMLHYM